MGVKFGMGSGPFRMDEWTFNGPRSTPRAKFHSHRCNDKGIGLQKLNILLKFDQTSGYKRPAAKFYIAVCAIFTKFAEFVPRFSLC